MNLRQLVAVLPIIVSTLACAAGLHGIPTVQISQYAFQPNPIQAQVKSDITITAQVLRVTDMYQHPELFSFRQEVLPRIRGPRGFVDLKDDSYLSRNYPKDAMGLQWEYWFAADDLSSQVVICWIRIKNATDHILRMRDARIYMVVEGQEPIPAVAGFNTLLRYADEYERIDIEQAESKGGLFKSIPPAGWTHQALLRNSTGFKLVNDVSREILPGFSFEGMLAFPPLQGSSGPVQVSFFDITTKTDAAGNPVEKTRFDFVLQPQQTSMWFDRTDSHWKIGTPPAASTTKQQ